MNFQSDSLFALSITGGKAISEKLNICFKSNQMTLSSLSDNEWLAVFRVQIGKRNAFVKTLKFILASESPSFKRHAGEIDIERYERLFPLKEYDFLCAENKIRLPSTIVKGNPKNSRDYSVIWHFAADVSRKLRRPATVDEIKKAWLDNFLMRSWGDPKDWNIKSTAALIAERWCTMSRK